MKKAVFEDKVKEIIADSYNKPALHSIFDQFW